MAGKDNSKTKVINIYLYFVKYYYWPLQQLQPFITLSSWSDTCFQLNFHFFFFFKKKSKKLHTITDFSNKLQGRLEPIVEWNDHRSTSKCIITKICLHKILTYICSTIIDQIIFQLDYPISGLYMFPNFYFFFFSSLWSILEWESNGN